ncbi:DUF2383 domain-containing protein [uncultured Alsobacter sp.]|uniref:DUF2383 domain-containing protein n=1 Tax=uncultured Alsobacter sp. TaxID=1748258 RepID=UPI0025E9EF6A|nr:DUF2383 domain-containing protein [uncultured Alsobacter sp.]
MSDDALLSLHTALVDVREGYRTAIEKAEDPAVLAELRTVDGLHATAHADLDRILAARGDRPDEDGSLMGTVHKTVITARAAIVGLGEGSLDSFASGEENTLESYDDALRSEQDPTVKATLSQHRSALAAQVAKMKTVAARSS